MRKKRDSRDLQVFNLSFLDVVSCGFGAVIMLVLISHTSESTTIRDDGVVAGLLKNIFEYEQRIEDKRNEMQSLQEQLSAERSRADALNNARTQLRHRAETDGTKLQKLGEDVQGLELVESSMKRVSITPDTATQRDPMSGGIPVDSDYVIFIIDTSGSMQQIWRRVISELTRVLDIHPRVQGFQVLSDNGAYLLSGYSGKWIPDTQAARANALKLISSWNTASNSSPVEGLTVALRTYARSGKNISIYIFGDDYTGSSYGPVLNALDRLNRNSANGEPLVKVHAIGFVTSQSTNRFGILMREVAKRNRGTFLALPVR
jgi:hypothetical protein